MVARPESNKPAVIYPDSDGKRMADNTLQFEWIVTIKEGLELYFRDRPDVFVAGDLLWYPVEGDNKTRLAPDALTAFGRPKGYRGSYRQWEEGGIAPQVVFEVLSPGNRKEEMRRKRQWYARYGVQEYYEFNPYLGHISGWQCAQGEAVPIPKMENWTSPLLNITFSMEGLDLVLTAPDGARLLSYLELADERDDAQSRAIFAETRAEREQLRREAAEQEANQERQAREQAEARAREMEAELEALRNQIKRAGNKGKKEPGD